MKIYKLISFTLSLCLGISISFAQTFTNTAAHNFTNATVYTTTFTTSGIASGSQLRQVTLKFGDASIYSGDLASAVITLTNPGGTVVTLINPTSFNNGSTTTDADRKQLNITLRDHAALNTPWQYASATGNTISDCYPFNYGYWRVPTTGSYSNFTGTHNGTWTLTISFPGLSTSYARKYISSTLEFGSAFQFEDIITSKPNQSCADRKCIQTGTIYTATNNGYPQNQGLPFSIGGCKWNNDDNHAAWFYFTASNSTVNLSLSGMTDRIQTVVLQGDCGNFTLANGGCPGTMFTGSSNYTQYYKQSYAPGNGVSINHGYTLTGLTVGQQYILIVDGEGSDAQSNFYLEIIGADGCCATYTSTVSTTKTRCDSNTGTATVTPNGGQAPHQYDFGSGYTSSNVATGLSAGNHTYSVKDDNGCIQTGTFTIVKEDSPSITVGTIVDEACGNNNGSVDISVTGGTSPYTYSWSDGSTNEDLSGVSAGGYNVTVTDANGCTNNASATVGSITGLSITKIIKGDPTCNGDCDGSIEIVVAGGVPPYSYSWVDGSGNPVGGNSNGISDLCDGDYTVTITDASGGGGGSPIVIYSEDFNSGAPGWNLNHVMGSEGSDANFFKISDAEGGLPPGGCGVANNGDPTLHVTSTFNPNGGAAYNAGGLCGFLMCVETHRQAESPTISTIGQTGLTLNFDFIARGQSSGADQATVWYNDGNGWTQLGSRIQSNLCPSNQGEWTAYSHALPTSCENISNLQIAIRWDNNDDGVGTDPSVAINNLTITTAGAGGGSPCTFTQTISISEPDPITIATSTTTSNCSASTGTATATPSGGNGGYTYSWSPSGGTGATATGLAAGPYTVTVTDNKGCSNTANVTITNPSSPTVSIANQQDVNCSGQNTGSATVNATGGTGSYTYTWSPNVSSSASATNLAAGVYNVTVTDGAGCTGTQTITIATNNQTPTISASAASTTVCEGEDIELSLSITDGGSSPVISWNGPGAYSSSDQNPTISPASASNSGTYTVTVEGDGGCTSAQSQVTVTVNPKPTLSTTASDVTCNGDNNGSASVTATGNGTMTYSWSPSGGNAATATGLSSGTYTVTVTDGNNCENTATVVITEPDALTVTTSTTQSDCSASTGTATATPSGGNGGYTYTWNPSGGTSATETGLAPGTHSVTVTDSKGCSETVNVNITTPNAPTISVASQQDATCDGGTDGSATINVTGGTGTMTYSWSPNVSSTNTASNLTNGTYTVTVTDDANCTNFETIVIGATNPTPTISASAASTTVCEGEDIELSLSITDGGSSPVISWTGPGTYSSSDQNPTISPASASNAGTYTVTVEGDGGCTSAQSQVTVTVNPKPTLSTTASDVTCNGDNNGSASVTATGNGTMTYSWSPSGGNAATASGLAPGTYTVTVTDGNSCQNTATVVIAEPTALSVSTSTTQSGCAASTGSATATPTGGNGGYTYSWNDITNQTTQTASNLAAGTYTVTVTDSKGCSITANAIVTNSSGPIVTIASQQNVDCSAQNTGSATVNVTGGTGSYTYTWDPNVSTSASASNLAAGTYTVYVTDGGGCAGSETITIVANNQTPTISASAASTTVCEGEDIELSLSITDGGSSPVISWTGPGTYSSSDQNPTISPASAGNSGTYMVTVQGDGGCTSAQSQVTVTVNPKPTLSTTASDVTCNGDNNGSASVTATGNGTMTYSWSPSGGNAATASGLAPGTYTVTVTDGNTCENTATVVITEPDALTATTSSQDADCGSNNGEATVSVSGGTGSYSYSWDDSSNQTTATATNLAIGTYHVTVSDDNGCSITETIIVVNPNAPTLSIINSQDVNCEGDTDGSAEALATGGSGNYTYNWSPSGGSDALATNLGEGTYTVTVTDDAGCSSTESITINANHPLPILDANAASNHVCIGGDIELTVSITNGVTPDNYNWTGPNGFTSSDQNPTIPNADSNAEGTYTVSVTSADGCISAASTITITMSDQPSVDANALSQSVCEGDQIFLTATTDVTDPVSYSWTGPNGFTSAFQNPIITNASTDNAGTYEVTVTTPEGCSSDIDQVTIVINPLPNVGNITETNANGCSNESLTLNVSNPQNNYTYYWEFDNHVVNQGTSHNTSANSDGSGDYYIYAQTDEGCTALAQIIHVTLEPCDITIVETFSPNNDGSNDYFHIGNLESYPNTEVWIYTRWGLEVYHNENYLNDWDGTSQSKLNVTGNELPEGTYFYVVKLGGPEGQKNSGKEYKGYVYIKR
ncbi:MAG: gliding motility-associated C-terminal domain-containing protein [Brumimicrobium sp.]|nr:gliding motility-associated C-terminal domain-containing protein [Brumimicrobium sp.]